jgi:peptide/nickel transport system ATP-binding protein
VEFNSTENIFRRPEHPYTKALIASIPRLPLGLSSSQADREALDEVRGEMELAPPRSLNLSPSNQGFA